MVGELERPVLHNARLELVGACRRPVAAQEVDKALAEALVVARVYERVDEGARHRQPVAHEEQRAKILFQHDVLVVEAVQCDHLHGRPRHNECQHHEEGHFDHLNVGEQNLLVY